MRSLKANLSVIKFLKDLEPKPFKQIWIKVLSLLSNATPPDSAQVSGYTPFRRTDIGEYRIIYRFDENTIYIAVIGKRNDSEVYKKLNRLLQ